MRNAREDVLTKKDLRELEREYRIYLQQHRHIPGRKCDRETFMLAAARKKLGKNRLNHAAITNDALIKHLKKCLPDLSFKKSCYPDPSLDLMKALRFAKTKAWRAVLAGEKLQGRFLAGPFAHAVTLVLAGLEGGKVRTRRELMRIFRVPGSKNCSAEDLARFQHAIDQMAADIAAWRPNPNDPNLDPARNPLIPNTDRRQPRRRR